MCIVSNMTYIKDFNINFNLRWTHKINVPPFFFEKREATILFSRNVILNQHQPTPCTVYSLFLAIHIRIIELLISINQIININNYSLIFDIKSNY